MKLDHDAARFLENLPRLNHEVDHLGAIYANFFAITLAFDHQTQKLLISIIPKCDRDHTQVYQQAQEKIALIIQTLQQSRQITIDGKVSSQKFTITTDVPDEQFQNLVRQAKIAIAQGEIFQIVLSRCFQKQYTGSPFTRYRALRQVSPSPYMFYLPLPDGSIAAGASPEQSIKVQQQQVTVNPIAGTRRRVLGQEAAIAQSLLNDDKEIAEHMMLVDLGRNDLGKVCQPGSITVSELMQVKHFSHVSHLVSVVTGQLAADKTSIDALAAVFPAGTLSGAPKIRAMQLIDQLETTSRGLYGGTIWHMDGQKNIDSCIAIRMMHLKDGIATIRTGAGIVHDSDPVSETEETRHKAQALFEALALAEEMSA